MEVWVTSRGQGYEFFHGLRGSGGQEKEMGKERREQDSADRQFSYLCLRAALSSYNANNKQYPIKMFFFPPPCRMTLSKSVIMARSCS